MNSHYNDLLPLVLGTAQLGMDYGIANKTGKPGFKQAIELIKAAWEKGVRFFETGQAYGESEKILGEAFKSLKIDGEAKVISKFNPKLDHLDSTAMRHALEQTLVDLNTTKLFGVMLHRESQLNLWDNGLGAILTELVDAGLVEQIGVSVYSPEMAIQALKTDGIIMVQLPSNLLERRFEHAGVFDEAEQKVKQIYVRSVFLQGLLLMDVDELSESMHFAAPVLKRVDKLAKKIGLNRQELSLGYVRMAYPSAKVIFGAETANQVRDNLDSWTATFPRDIVGRVRCEFRDIEERILNPALWPD